ncbi:L-serine ammonia-lyase [Ancylomarina salipaludis]|uniref:L-serine dehydratase n=1 Tax=Ancylomarina salipaludis TaxID=2501299 RepID=A0A4Q1JMY8_9BACT|nr:L-serine ammonia-lyase [Ancylomarina salipaludis]RXQ95968.1 L-serine ammonia-lyase [Ancylomarina salipaludis]
MQSLRELYKIGYGPSSSHTIAPGRAAKMFIDKHPTIKSFRVTLYGSLAATGVGHGTDKVIETVIKPLDVEIIWKPEIELPLHPNGLLFEAIEGDKVIDAWEVYSVGGGDLRDNTGLLNDASQVYELTTMNDILAWCIEEGRSFWEYVEFCEGKEIWSFLEDVWEVMKDSIARGLEEEGVLPGTLRIARKAGSYYIRSKTTTGSTGNIGLIFAAALAVAEENAASGKVVTAPTCGASGVVPSVLYFLKVDQEYSDKRIIRGLATAGLIGNIVKTNGSISGAEVGCQGELGTACAMAAGAAAQIMGGTPKQVEYAAEMGFEHNLGLTCDPVDGYVQIPCIERNAFISQKARECAVYSLFSDGSHKVSFDQVVETMMQTGKDLQSKYRETSLGGLARIVRPVIKKG